MHESILFLAAVLAFAVVPFALGIFAAPALAAVDLP